MSRPDWTAGDRFDAVMNYPLAEAILGFAGAHHLDDAVVHSHAEYSQIVRLSGAEMAGRIESILGAYAPESAAVQLNLLDSHDTPRIRTLLSGDAAAIRMAYLLQAALPGAPCVYYGDEIGMEGANDPDNRRAYPWDEAAWDQATLRVRPGGHRPAPRPAHPARRGGPDRRYVRRLAGDPALRSLGRAERRARWCPAGAGDRQCRRGCRTRSASTQSELAGRRLDSALATRTGPDEPGLGGCQVGPDGRLELVVPARFGSILLPA